MTITKKILLSCVSVTLFSTLPSIAAQADDEFTLSANASIVSDYRFRGLSLSSKEAAIQGGFDLGHKSGFYVGTWASSIESYGGSEIEMDIYGGYSSTVGGLTYDVGVLAYTYPGSDDTHYIEGYGSLAGAYMGVDWTVGAAYSVEQDNLGGKDNLYIYADFGYAIPDTKISLSSHIGREKGAFSRLNGDAKLDWNLGASYALTDAVSFSVQYVDTNMRGIGSAGAVFSLGASF